MAAHRKQISSQPLGVHYRKLWRGTLPPVVFSLLALNILIFIWHNSLARQRQENLLVAPSAAAAASAGDVRWDKSVGENLDKYLSRIPDATQNRLAIVTGMSQMYAVNDAKPGDRIIVEHLDDALSQKGAHAFGLAAPNMHNEEALLLLLTTLRDPKTHPSYFIYGVCFDKFRNVDLRPALQSLLHSKPELIRAWRETATQYRDRYPKAAEKMLASLSVVEASQKKQELTFEERLRNWTAKCLPLVAARQDINATVMMKLFELRNWVFNITPQSKRPILQARYDLNQEFLQMLADVAKKNSIKPIFYIIPLNPLADNPYIPGQYDSFKQWIQQTCLEKEIPFANLEGVVPSEYWGEFMGGPDFKHFRGEGHAITAKAILKVFGPILLKGKVVR